MEDKTREIAAIAASVAGHCQPCLKHHLEKARLLGVPEDDSKVAIRLAMVISGKGDECMQEYADSLLHGLVRPKSEGNGTNRNKGV